MSIDQFLEESSDTVTATEGATVDRIEHMVHHLANVPGVKDKVDVSGFDSSVQELLHTMKTLDPKSKDYRLLHTTLNKAAQELQSAEYIAES